MSAIDKHNWLRVLIIIVSAAFGASANAQSITYLHTDELGSVLAESDANGNVTKRVTYEPYGGTIGGALQDGPGYTGHVSDVSTGLTYMQQRYYDSQLGLFISADPVTPHGRPIGQFHRYRYANQNPYTNTDPDGRECNNSGCWVTSEERKAALSGDWKGYYEKAGAAGDGYARRAGEVANNAGATLVNARLSALTNKFLADSIAQNMGADPRNLTASQRVGIEFKMEGVRTGLAIARVNMMDRAGASPTNPMSFERKAFGAFHEEVFQANGASPQVFGGYKVDAAETFMNYFGGTTRSIYDYCPQPSCSK